MARWEITNQGNTTVVKRRHPFLGALVTVLAIGLVVSGIERTPWLIVPTVFVLVLALLGRVKGTPESGSDGHPPDASGASITYLPKSFPVRPVTAGTRLLESTPVVTAIGVADELTKLARLRAEGIMTEAEFRAQKEKLLGHP